MECGDLGKKQVQSEKKSLHVVVRIYPVIHLLVVDVSCVLFLDHVC